MTTGNLKTGKGKHKEIAFKKGIKNFFSHLLVLILLGELVTFSASVREQIGSTRSKAMVGIRGLQILGPYSSDN